MRTTTDQPRPAWPPIASLEELTGGDFHTGECPDCGTYIQGNSQVWAEHRRVLHSDGWVYLPYVQANQSDL